MRENIDESAVRIRLEPINWPEGLDRQGLGGPILLHGAIVAAEDAFRGYTALRDAVSKDVHLTPEGKRAKCTAWADANLPKLAKHMRVIRETSDGVEQNLPKAILEAVAPPATDPGDLALLSEIRAYLRSLPESQRVDKVRLLSSKGDNTALRAVATAPGYLTGLNKEMLGHILDDAAARAAPEKFANLEKFRKAANVADRAVEGVMRLISQETAAAPVEIPPPPRAAVQHFANVGLDGSHPVRSY